jgi:acetylornithine/succinyldiaminopimelate/putrescine aminotransferase
VLSAAAGGAIPIGAIVARFERLRPRWLEEEFRHTVIAFGGGVLLTAVRGIRALPRRSNAGARGVGRAEWGSG